MNPTDWATKKAEQVTKAQRLHQLERLGYVEDIRVKKMYAPGLWEQIRNRLKERIALFNRQSHGLEWHEVDSREAVIRTFGAEAHVTFDPEALRIKSLLSLPLTSADRNYEYTARLVDDIVMFCDGNDAPQTEEEVVEQILDQVIKPLLPRVREAYRRTTV